MKNDLFSATAFGAIELKNRIVMAPMTRSRAGAGDAPTAMNAQYYAQRAGAGLIITEGTQPSPHGKGYCRTPGIHSEQQLAGWREAVRAVGEAGSNMVLQLMHCGRIASHHNKEPEARTVAPSAIQAKGKMYTEAAGMVDFDTPQALQTDQVREVIEEYAQGTANAYAAGFAGVELHGTSGYLPAQFLSTGTNQRADRYGGAVNNRIRFVVETLEAMCGVGGANRVGLRICPGNPFNDLHDEAPQETFRALLQAISGLGLAYLHVIRMPSGPVDNVALAQQHFDGPLIVNDSFDLAEARATIANDDAQAISFARHFVANPDLVDRFVHGTALAAFDRHTLYTAGAEGYIDYPAIHASPGR